MSSTHAQPDPSGKFSSENTPQVVVRAGKYFVCSSCGVMVEVPADVVGQMVVVAEHLTNETADDEPAAVQTSHPPKPVRRVETPRPHYAKPSSVDCLSFKKIDGLHVPTNGQLDRAMAWVAFRLRVLDRQRSELGQLKKLLKKRARETVSCGARPAPAKKRESQSPHLNTKHHQPRDAPKMASKRESPSSQNAKERGPP